MIRKKVTLRLLNRHFNCTFTSDFMLMTRYILTSLVSICFAYGGTAQTMADFADSIRKAYHIPELGYAVISSEKIHDLQVMGLKHIGFSRPAELNDKFRIGSNTKTVTGFIAAQLVKENRISWYTKFFDLFPELKAKSNPAYHHLSLLDLLTFRTRLSHYTYTDVKPLKSQFTGDDSTQRYQFIAWCLQQKPVHGKDSINFSNPGYTAAGMMLEKASGKPYKTLVTELGNTLGIQFGFGAPNSSDSLQPWGHDPSMKPEAPGDHYKLNWLLPAGNIHVSLPDYAKFIQLQLQGLKGQSTLLNANEFSFLLYGRPRFAVGWFWQEEQQNQGKYAYHIGNPGSFLSKVYIFNQTDKAFILFSNAQTEETDEGLDIVFEELKRRFNGPSK
jgi:CubicO group peptidase (beta-lactamase class C family)